MTRGPKPRKRPAVQPNIAGKALARPDWLDGQAAKRWDYTIARLEELDKLNTADEAAIIRYCEEWSQWLDCVATIRAGGLTYETELNGQGVITKERPEVKISQRLAASMTRFETLFGLNASSRHTLMPQEPPPKTIENPLDKMRAMIG